MDVKFGSRSTLITPSIAGTIRLASNLGTPGKFRCGITSHMKIISVVLSSIATNLFSPSAV